MGQQQDGILLWNMEITPTIEEIKDCISFGHMVKGIKKVFQFQADHIKDIAKILKLCQEIC